MAGAGLPSIRATVNEAEGGSSAGSAGAGAAGAVESSALADHEADDKVRFLGGGQIVKRFCLCRWLWKASSVSCLHLGRAECAVLFDHMTAHGVGVLCVCVWFRDMRVCNCYNLIFVRVSW